MAKQEQHLTTARLSAFIDGQLAPEEQAQTEAHLQTCATCQQQLTELRQTVALLHALPQPKLPRSFTLPIAEPAPAIAPRVPSTARPLAPITPLRQRNAWPVYAANVVRYASGLAAIIGIVFLLSGLFGTPIGVSSGSSTTSTTGSSVNTTATNVSDRKPHITTPLVPGNTYQGLTPSPTSTQGQSVTRPNQNEPVQQNPFQVFLTLFTIGMTGTRTIIGVVLVVLAIIGFIVVRRL